MKPFVAALFLVLLAFAAYAQKTDYWKDSVGKGVYQRCQGEDIQINQPYLKLANNTTITKIAWPYPEAVVTKVVGALTSGEPYDNYFQGCQNQEGGVISRNRTGCAVLTCANNTLDIVWTTYYWNGEIIEQSSMPPPINTTENNATDNNNTVRPGDAASSFKFPKQLVVILLVLLLIGLFAFIFLRKKPKRRRR